MYTIIKVKRKLGDDPAECLIIESKKKRIDSKDDDTIFQKEVVLKYAGSASNEHEITEKVKEFQQKNRTKDEMKREYRQPRQTNLKEELIKEQKKESQNQRYFLVNSKRGLGDANIIDVVATDDKENKIPICDDEITCNGERLVKEKIDTTSSQYTYDLYYTRNTNIFVDSLMNNYVIKAGDFNEILVNDEDFQDDDEKYADDDEDSNDENNWRNEYPEDEDYYDNDDNAHDDEYYDDNHGYDYEDYGLSSMMKKSLNVDYFDNDCDSDDDYEEYLNDYETKESYNAFKKRVLKEFGDDQV